MCEALDVVLFTINFSQYPLLKTYHCFSWAMYLHKSEFLTKAEEIIQWFEIYLVSTIPDDNHTILITHPVSLEF